MTRWLPLLLLAACATPDAPPAPLSGTSLYLVDTPWTTDADTSLRLADLRGRPVALAMVYTTCGTACPTLVRDMQALGADAPGLAYVLVSLDPETDSPMHLRMFREAHRLGDDWTLLTGTPDDVQTLAAVLGVRYRREPDGTIAHSNRITLLDCGGDVAARLDGLGADPAPALASLHRALGADS